MRRVKQFWGWHPVDSRPDRIGIVPERTKASVGGASHFLFFPDQPLRERDELLAMSAVPQHKEALQQSQANRRCLVGIQQSKLWRHSDAIHF
jgi:hypothetical protein